VSRVVYLIHFNSPIGDPTRPKASASHYIGSAADLTARLTEHAAGRGARIMAAVVARGIGWHLVRCWPGGWALERRLKRWHKHAQLCPECRPHLKRRRSRRRFSFAPS
jgi:predicted GIY-YIG superfamily endonuclease